MVRFVASVSKQFSPRVNEKNQHVLHLFRHVPRFLLRCTVLLNFQSGGVEQGLADHAISQASEARSVRGLARARELG